MSNDYPISLILLFLAALFYVPYLFSKPENYTPLNEIIIKKDPVRLLGYTVYMVVLTVAAIYEHINGLAPEDLAEGLISRLLGALIVLGFALISLSVKVKSYKFIRIDYVLAGVVAIVSVAYFVTPDAAYIFGIAALVQCVWSMFKFGSKINI